MAASGQPDPAMPTAEEVGHAFARQYYTVLHQSPGLVYRFYQDMSQHDLVDDGGTMGSTITMEAINEKIQSYGNLMAELKSVDAQESFNSGILVLITGVMINKDNSRRSFTQTFFLAPQDKYKYKYFVLNDIFRYMEDEDSVKEDGAKEVVEEEDVKGDDKLRNASVEPNIHDYDATPEQEENASGCMEEVNGGEVINPAQYGEDACGEEEEPVPDVVDKVPIESQIVTELNIQVEEVPKKSYASIVKVMKENIPSPSPAFPRSAIKMKEQVIAAPPPTSVAGMSFSSTNVVDDGYIQETEGDGCSVYLKNLPLNATPSMVEEVFKRFGAIKSGGIQVRSNRGFCFGFVEFEVTSSAQNAIEASPVTVGGRLVGIEEKKSTSTRGSGRGRYPPGRGGAFRSEGARGRGSYGGGRGYGRGDTLKNEYSRGEYGRTNGRGFQNRSNDGYQRNDQMSNGFGRGSRGGGPALNPAAGDTPGVAASA